MVVVLLVSVLVYDPLRSVLLWRVRRLVLGEREHPYDVVAGLAATLEATDRHRPAGRRARTPWPARSASAS